MIQRGGRFGFDFESLAFFSIRGDMMRQKLDGNKALKFCVLGLVNDTHAALTEFLNDVIM
jgi:hypothetical protein